MIYPRQELADFLLGCGNLCRRVACYAIGFSQVAAQVPDPLAIGCGVGGDGDARLGAAAQAVGIQWFEVRAFGHDHMQRPCLHGRLLKAQGVKQALGARASTEHDALGPYFTAVHAQANQ
ncbi:hypothetical protein D3C79_919530 [compost metagenome]